MKLVKGLIYTAIVAVPMAAFGQANNPCSSIKWNLQFLNAHPKAPVACQTVEVKDGVKYAKFSGRVVNVEGGNVELDVHNVAGTSIGKSKWSATPDSIVMVGDKEEKVSELKKGDDLTFWIAENTMKLAPKPGSKAVLTPITK